jgi:hypothetical protein
MRFSGSSMYRSRHWVSFGASSARSQFHIGSAKNVGGDQQSLISITDLNFDTSSPMLEAHHWVRHSSDY